MEHIYWCPTDACKNAACVITIANSVWCSEGHLMLPIGYIESGKMVSTDIRGPKRIDV